ncbi:cytochrome C oxidase subunit I [Streptomyces sp. NPDC006739]|uniref:cytochrome C oxidase subunit I n=1 Tax=Streptomyces sp. NPDC006739 TaxID=3364763 RepID=UPI0036BC1767
MSDLPREEVEAAALVNEVEGYLLWQATITVAEQRAREFVQPMEWLTTAQRDEIEQRYVTDSLHRARQDLERIAARCRSLRAEYEQRYRTLRLRWVTYTLAVGACLTSVTTAALSLTR